MKQNNQVLCEESLLIRVLFAGVNKVPLLPPSECFDNACFTGSISVPCL